MNRRFSFFAAPVAAVVLVMGGVLLFLLQQQTGEKVASIAYSPDQFQFVVGSGHMSDGKLLVDGYQNGFALISSGPVEVNAENHRVLRLHISTGQHNLELEQAPAFFWRRKKWPDNVTRLSLTGAQLIDLGESMTWKRDIIEIGFLFKDIDGQTIELGDMSLEDDVLATQVELMHQAWFQYEPWSQRSVNYLYGGLKSQPLPLQLVVLVWALLTVLIYWILDRRRPAKLVIYGLATLLLAWFVLDIRWTINGVRQMKFSIENQWALSNHERMLGGLDGKLYKLINRFKDKILNEKRNRIVVVGDLSRFDYHMKRAKYHLYPDSVLVRGQLLKSVDPNNVDYVLFVGDFTVQRASWNEIWQQLPIADNWRDVLQLVDSGDMGILFAVKPDTP